MNKLNINGSLVASNVSSIVVANGRVVVDGVDVTPDIDRISIEVVGDVESIDVAYCRSISVSNVTGSVKTQSGDVKAGNIGGSVKTMSGDVNCGNVAGDVETMSGDINHRG